MKNKSITDIGAITRKRTISGGFDPGDCMAMLSRLEKYDIWVERKSLIATILFNLVFLAGAIALGVYMYTTIEAEGFWFFLIAAGTLFGGAIVYGLLLGLVNDFYFKKDLDNTARLFLKPLLDALRHDLKKGSRIYLDMDLFPATDEKDFREKSDVYEKGVYFECRDWFYERDLLSLKLVLNDGNRLQLHARETLTVSERRKRNPKGKLKVKNKCKKRTSFLIRMRANPALYGVDTPPQNYRKHGIKKLDVKQTAKGPMLVLAYKEKGVGETYESPGLFPDQENTLRHMARLYSFLSPETGA